VIVSQSRAELAAEVARLRVLGLTQLEIAKRLGIGRSWVATLCNDPDGSKQKARRETYTGICERCGGETKSSGTSRPSRLCANCSREVAHESRIWTREKIIEAIQEWAAQHGRPPTANDWLHADPGGRWPNRGSVYNEYSYPRSVRRSPFACWADAIEDAGFPRPRTGARPGDPHWTPRLVIERLQEKAVDGVAPPSQEESVLQKYARQFFGSWAQACAAAGVTPRRTKAYAKRLAA